MLAARQIFIGTILKVADKSPQFRLLIHTDLYNPGNIHEIFPFPLPYIFLQHFINRLSDSGIMLLLFRQA